MSPVLNFFGSLSLSERERWAQDDTYSKIEEIRWEIMKDSDARKKFSLVVAGLIIVGGVMMGVGGLTQSEYWLENGVVWSLLSGFIGGFGILLSWVGINIMKMDIQIKYRSWAKKSGLSLEAWKALDFKNWPAPLEQVRQFEQTLTKWVEEGREVESWLVFFKNHGYISVNCCEQVHVFEKEREKSQEAESLFGRLEVWSKGVNEIHMTATEEKEGGSGSLVGQTDGVHLQQRRGRS